MTKRVFLDYAATAPLLPEVREALNSPAVSGLGNASALYLEGKLARQALEQARTDLAEVLSCSPHELYFCSGGTEAAGTLVEGITRSALEKSGKKQARMHVVCAAFEHHAVLNSVLSLKRLGFEVELVRPNREGRISPESLRASLRPDTLMVAVMLAQNELGTVQDIGRLAELSHGVGALFVCDCVQGLGKLLINLADSGIDAACFSSHKIGGPYGVGAFFLRSSVPCSPRQLGGGQERRIRSGTQDVPGAVGFSLAAKLETAALLEGEGARLAVATDGRGDRPYTAPAISAGEGTSLAVATDGRGDRPYKAPAISVGEGTRLATLRDRLFVCLTHRSDRIRSTVTILEGDTSSHLPGHLHLLVEGIESQTMVLKLDELGYAVSGGAACSTNSLEPSHVLTSMGISKDKAYGALRISMGRETTAEDCASFADALISILS